DRHVGEVVAAAAAGQRVAAAAAAQDVVAGIADQGVGQRIATTVDVRRAGQGQVLEVGSQGEADAADHLVDAAVRTLAHLVAGVGAGGGGGAGLGDDAIGAESAAQRVVAGAAADGVVALAAGDLRAAAGDAQEHDRIGPEEIGEAGSDAVVDRDRFDPHDT